MFWCYQDFTLFTIIFTQLWTQSSHLKGSNNIFLKNYLQWLIPGWQQGLSSRRVGRGCGMGGKGWIVTVTGWWLVHCECACWLVSMMYGKGGRWTWLVKVCWVCVCGLVHMSGASVCGLVDSGQLQDVVMWDGWVEDDGVVEQSVLHLLHHLLEARQDQRFLHLQLLHLQGRCHTGKVPDTG